MKITEKNPVQNYSVYFSVITMSVPDRTGRLQAMESEFVKALIHNDHSQVRSLYYSHRDAFFAFGKKYGVKTEDLADLYQEAFLALRKQAIRGKLDNVQSSLKTYLFGIGKNMIYNYLKQRSYLTPLLPDMREEEPYELPERPSLSPEQKLLHTHFKSLGEKCRLVLTLFYYRGLTIKEIQEAEGYASENVVKSQKSRCLKTLKDLIASSK